MRTHLIIFILAALPLAMAAHANEISLDAGGMHRGSSSAANAPSAQGDCASARSVPLQEHGDSKSNGTGRSAATGSVGTRLQVSDGAGEESAAGSAAGSSTTGKPMTVPVKSRTTRWQSLVPGAIK